MPPKSVLIKIALFTGIGTGLVCLVDGLMWDFTPFNEYQGMFWLTFIPLILFFMKEKQDASTCSTCGFPLYAGSPGVLSPSAPSQPCHPQARLSSTSSSTFSSAQPSCSYTRVCSIARH